MARKEVLVQLDDQLVADLDRIAAERGTSRSELLRLLARALVETEEEARADDQLIKAYRAIPEDPLETAWLARLAAENAVEW